MGDNLVYAVRGNTGLYLRRGLGKDCTTLFEDKENPKQTPCEVFAFSNDGQFFAFCDSKRTMVINVATGKDVISVDLPRTKSILFSPKDSHVVFYQQYAIFGNRTSADQKPDPNVRVYNLKGGNHVATMIATKEAVWKPQWSDDESWCLRLVGSEILCHAGHNYDRCEKKLVVEKIDSFALSRGTQNLHIACFIKAHGSNPGRVQVRKLNDDFTMMANKTFFKADKADMLWNNKGSSVLIVTSVEVDASNQSYYGEQKVYMINVQLDESFMVPLNKNGPVYSVKWNPNCKEFAICYGYMPAKLTMYSHKGDPIFDAAEGPRNELYYNAFGNILIACGFGNIAKGKMEFWDVDNKKEIISIDVPNTTQFEWAPDGQHFITATTTPRLRIDNCYRLWHYSGKLVSEFTYESPKEELWQVMFRPMAGYNKFQVRELTKADKMQAGLLIKRKDSDHPLNNLPAGAVRQAGAYVPPHLRNKRAGAPASSAAPSNGNAAEPMKPQMTDQERKLFNLNKKIQDISKLKEKLKAGETLQKNQLEKISKEQELLSELAALKVSS